ncbi:gliding motility lipoprotein GldB [Hyunsoonleella rubra]|uniref:Gliding motility lipoprotein GldB n=1 Tax=Hyunsoonleella rubra TaxID=1737062 RepID=A0ABW5TCI7_9FLAO
MKNLIFPVLLIVVISCGKDNTLEQEIAKVNTDISVERFDLLFGEITEGNLPELKRAYPFMFSEKFPDSFWIAKTRDTIQRELFREVAEVFPNLDEVEMDIESLFNHLKYYFPEFSMPRVITTTSMVDYRNRVIVTDTIAIIALDNYLGKEHFFYQEIQKYIRKNFEAKQIVVDLASEYAGRYIYQPQRKTLLDEMVYFGKQLYFKDIMLPNVSEAERMGYSESEFEWARVNEHYIWRYFIERELLYSTDTKLLSRFINPAPFSKFYLEEIDADSPGRLGQYIGWQIVRAYMKNNEVSIKDMLQMKPEDIFNNSKFKPRK